MVIGAVLVSLLSVVCMGLGVILITVPIWGAVFAFGAPALALTGVVLGGLAMSDANKRKQPTGFALASVIMNVLAFLPASFVALTCGVCNALVSSGGLQPTHVQWVNPQNPGLFVADAGAPPPPFTEPAPMPKDAGAADAGKPSAAPAPTDLPPPPLPAGPTK